MANTADADPERGCNAGAAPLRNAAPENVGGVGSGSEIEKYSCCQKQGEMMNRAQIANSLGNRLHHHAHAIGLHNTDRGFRRNEFAFGDNVDDVIRRNAPCRSGAMS